MLRAWTCAFCKHGLPLGLSRFALVTAAKRLYRIKHARRDTSLKAIHKARAARYRKDPSQQPLLLEGKRRLSQALKRKSDSLDDLAKGTGHKLVLWEPDWDSWPRRSKEKTKRRVGTLITCTRCHRIGNAGWDTPCIGESGSRTGAQRALWARLSQAGGQNLQDVLKLWGSTQAEVEAQMFKSSSFVAAEKHGHKVAWFTPHWPTWKAKSSSRLAKENMRFLTCSRCLRVSGGDWDRKRLGAAAVNRSKLRAHWMETSLRNRRLLLEIWGLTQERVNARLGLGKCSLALKNHKRAKLVFDGVECQPGPSTCQAVRVLNLNVGGASGSWALFREGYSHQFDVLLLQEVKMTDNEWRAYVRRAAKQGFTGYYEPGQTSRDRWCNQAPRGGVAVFVSRRLRQLRVAAFSGQHSQMLVVSAQGYQFASLYVPPGHGGVPETEACAFLTEWLSSQSAQQPWVLGTDVNEEIDDCEPLQLLTSFGGYPKRVFRPTRWEGNRELPGDQ